MTRYFGRFLLVFLLLGGALVLALPTPDEADERLKVAEALKAAGSAMEAAARAEQLAEDADQAAVAAAKGVEEANRAADEAARLAGEAIGALHLEGGGGSHEADGDHSKAEAPGDPAVDHQSEAGIAAHEDEAAHADSAEGAHGEGDHDADGGGHGEHHGLTEYAPVLFKAGPFVVTNSMVISLLVALIITVVVRVACGSMERVPNSRLQNFVEWLIESLYGLIEGVMGADLAKKTFWFFGTLFIFILLTNWISLIPGVGTIGWNVEYSDGSHVFEPFLRGGNADLNMTAAMAFTFSILWFYWAIRENGVGGFIAHLFAPKGENKGFMKLMMIGIFLFLGVIEVLSILMRPVALQFRLYGNIFAGENILESMLMMPGIIKVLAPIPFYFLELLVGLVQAMVFLLLTTVFTVLICEHEHHEEGEGHAH